MEQGRIFYIADTHYSHKGILKTRPAFPTVQAMNTTMLAAWRNRVKDTDTVYILGDLFGFSEDIDILEQLTGQLILICGNHEQSWLHHIEPKRYFRQVYDTMAERIDNGRSVVMSHFPQPQLYPGDAGWLLFGHLHTAPPRREDWKWVCSQPRALNVGADIAYYTTGSYAPATLDEWIFFNEVWKADHTVEHKKT